MPLKASLKLRARPVNVKLLLFFITNVSIQSVKPDVNQIGLARVLFFVQLPTNQPVCRLIIAKNFSNGR